jgi:YD repeat-containing protein
VQVIDPLGAQQRWSYQGGDGSIRLLSASASSGGMQVANRTFNNNANLPVTQTDFLGTETTFAWDMTRRLLIKVIKASNKEPFDITSTTWHPTLTLPTLITVSGSTTAYTYDNFGNKLTETVTDTNTVPNVSRTTAWAYNAQGLVASMTTPRGHVHSYTYDSVGNLSTATNPLGQITQYTQYNGAGQLLQSTDPNGVVSTYTYDARQRLTSESMAGQTSTYAYNPAGLLTRATLPNGAFVDYIYDPAQRLIAVADQRGNRIDYTLDNAGNRLSEQAKDPSGQLTRQITRIFDNLGRPQKITGLN